MGVNENMFTVIFIAKIQIQWAKIIYNHNNVRLNKFNLNLHKYIRPY